MSDRAAEVQRLRELAELLTLGRSLYRSGQLAAGNTEQECEALPITQRFTAALASLSVPSAAEVAALRDITRRVLASLADLPDTTPIMQTTETEEPWGGVEIGERESGATAGDLRALCALASAGPTLPDRETLAREELCSRITDYLSGGGLFNPEMANHDAVRDLLIDCRSLLAAPRPATPAAPEGT